MHLPELALGVGGEAGLRGEVGVLVEGERELLEDDANIRMLNEA